MADTGLSENAQSLGLRAATFTCKNRSSDWQNQAVDDEDMEEEEEMMKKYHRQKLADHEAHDVFCESTGPVQVCDTD